MRYSKQLNKHDPDNGQYGDCMRTVLSCIMDMDVMSVPNFAEGDPPDEVFWQLVDNWLKGHNLRLHSCMWPSDIDLSDVLRSVSALNPDWRFLLGGQSMRGTEHIVVCRDGMIEWDTAIDARPGDTMTQSTDGGWWIYNLAARV